MSPWMQFLLRRLAAIPLTLLIVTAALYGAFMLSSPEERAQLYLPPNLPRVTTPEKLQNVIDGVIAQHGLNDPYPQQYAGWLGRLLRGEWGWSPVLQGDVLELLLERAPVTIELALFSVLLLIPMGLIAGVLAGWWEGSRLDNALRLSAFVATSIPPFILGLFLLSIFYVGLYWFPPGRTSIVELSLQTVGNFRHYTGFLVLDGILNRRPDVVLDALRHLVLPVFTLSLVHWATLTRITRAAIIDVKDEHDRQHEQNAEDGKAHGQWCVGRALDAADNEIGESFQSEDDFDDEDAGNERCSRQRAAGADQARKA